MEQQTAFDRAMSLVDMPDVLSTKPSVVVANNALLGHTGTHIIQTARTEDGFVIFMQIMDTSGGGLIQVILPERVCGTIYRQRQSLIDRRRRKPRPKLTREEQRRERVREAKRILREDARNKR